MKWEHSLKRMMQLRQEVSDDVSSNGYTTVSYNDNLSHCE